MTCDMGLWRTHFAYQMRSVDVTPQAHLFPHLSELFELQYCSLRDSALEAGVP